MPPRAEAARPYRRRPGKLAIQNIKKLQKDNTMIVKPAAIRRYMSRLVDALNVDKAIKIQEALEKSKIFNKNTAKHPKFRISSNAVKLITSAMEHYGICVLRKANTLAGMAKRVTVTGKDVVVAELSLLSMCRNGDRIVGELMS